MVTESAVEELVSRPVQVPDELVEQARDKGWPEGLVARALQARVNRADVEFWLTHDEPSAEIERWIGWREDLLSGTLHVREATWQDGEGVADLYANAPEQIGEWQVTVERSPNPFAQFRLQEHVNMQLVVDRGVVFAAAAHSSRNTIVQGKRVGAHIASAWRVRDGYRGQGYSSYLRVCGGPFGSWFGIVNYWYMRAGNFGAVDWIKALRPDMHEQLTMPDKEMPGMPVVVHHFRARPFDGSPGGIRPARRADTRACIRLINRTHRGLDLFRPYTPEFLHERLDSPFWGPKPEFWDVAYSWDDYFVVEEQGRIVACAGLWDRGRDVREVWRHPNGDERTIATTALMDFGYAEGREDAMQRLLAFLLGRTHDLGRDALMAPIERLAALVERMAPYEPAEEQRRLLADVYKDAQVNIDVKVRKPYTDLAYW
jgi:hypothetical protein